MTKDEARLELFKELRENGFTKLFEDYSKSFITGIVLTKQRPIKKDQLIEILDNETDHTRDITDDIASAIKSIVSNDDIFRYHCIKMYDIIVHYIFIKNNSLKGRDLIEGDPTGVTIMQTNSDAFVETPSQPDGQDGEPVIGPKCFKLFSSIIIGGSHQSITDRTLGFITKHELAHVVFRYLTDILHPGIIDKYRDTLSEEDIDKFTEFLCDFIQFDTTVINKYTVNPVAKFVDFMPVLFTEDAIETYNPLVKAISPFYVSFAQ